MRDRKNERKDLHDLATVSIDLLRPLQSQLLEVPAKAVGTLLAAEMHCGNAQVPAEMLVQVRTMMERNKHKGAGRSSENHWLTDG